MRLDGRTAIVTGGAKGIGLAIVRRLVSEGAKVMIADIDEAAGNAAVEAVSGDGEVRFTATDVSERLDVHNLVAKTIDAFGSINALVNNAGIVHAVDFLDLEEADFDRVMAVNLKGSLLCGQAVARGDRGRGGHGGHEKEGVARSVQLRASARVALRRRRARARGGLARARWREWSRGRQSARRRRLARRWAWRAPGASWRFGTWRRRLDLLLSLVRPLLLLLLLEPCFFSQCLLLLSLQNLLPRFFLLLRALGVLHGLLITHRARDCPREVKRIRWRGLREHVHGRGSHDMLAHSALADRLAQAAVLILELGEPPVQPLQLGVVLGRERLHRGAARRRWRSNNASYSGVPTRRGGKGSRCASVCPATSPEGG